jgi:hypothetical protein
MHTARPLSFVLLAALFSGSALADAKVGDQATMEGYNETDGVRRAFSLRNSVIAFEAANHEFTVETLWSHDDGSSKSVVEKAVYVLNAEDVASIVANCEGRGGAREKIRVKAGEFETCHFSRGSEIWMAAVPFGFVKVSDTSLGSTVSYELSAYAFGR